MSQSGYRAMLTISRMGYGKESVLYTITNFPEKGNYKPVAYEGYIDTIEQLAKRTNGYFGAERALTAAASEGFPRMFDWTEGYIGNSCKYTESGTLLHPAGW